MTAVLRAVRAAPLAEVVWRPPSRPAPEVRGVVPLVGSQGPVLALPYAVADAARSLGSSPEVLLALGEPEGAGSGWEPLLLRCRPRLSEDREGDRFCEELLPQELLRHPPTRLLADSVLLRREHWWWLPRLLVDLEVLEATPLAPRRRGDHLLAVAGADGLAAGTARVDHADRAAPQVEPVPAPVTERASGGLPGPALPEGPAVLFGQAATPDFERWGQWSWRGRWDGAAFVADDVPDAVGLPSAPGLLGRWRRQRALERSCRAGIEAAGG